MREFWWILIFSVIYNCSCYESSTTSDDYKDSTTSSYVISTTKRPKDENICPNDVNSKLISESGREITWHPFKHDGNDSISYNISIKDINSRDDPTKNSTKCIKKCSFIYNQFKPGRNYKVEVRAGNCTVSPITVKIPFALSQPKNLKITDITSEGFNISWDKPDWYVNNLTKYKVDIKITKEDRPVYCEEILKRNHTFYTFEQFWYFQDGKPYTKYIVEIKAFIESEFNVRPSNQSVMTLGKDPDPPLNLKNITEKNNVNLTWSRPCKLNGNISHFELSLNGIYRLNNKDPHNLLKNISYTNNLNNYTYVYIYKDLKPYYLYNCTIKTVLFNEKKSIGMSTSFKTPAVCPGEPTNLNVIEMDSYILIEWTEPKNRSGKIIEYNIRIEDKGSLQYTKYCPKQNFSITHNTSKTNFIFNDYYPYHEYQISVSAYTDAGQGLNKIKQLNTNATEPEKVENLKNETLLEINNKSTFKYEVNISWDMPCLNGELNKFHFKFDSVELRKGQKLHYNNGKTMETYFILYLKPFRTYNVSVWVETKTGKGRSETIQIKTPSGYPKIPKNISFVPNESNITMLWEENEVVSNITGYGILVDPLGPRKGDLNATELGRCYYYVEEKPLKEDLNVTELGRCYYYVEEKRLEFPIVPYYKYNITIWAIADHCNGTENVTTVESLPSVPENVRDIRYSIDSSNNSIKLSFSFRQPRRFNGEFKKYITTLKSNNKMICSINIINNSLAQNDECKKIKIHYFNKNEIETLLEHNKTYNITIYVEAFKNISTSFEIITPQKLIQPEVNKNGVVSFQLKKKYFSELKEQIMYYAILLHHGNKPDTKNLVHKYYYNVSLSENNFETNFWSDDNWRKEANGYHYITTPLWNPMEGNKSEVFIKICPSQEIECEGDNNIQENMLEDSNYSISVRAFTNSGFRDSEEIFFHTACVSGIGFGAILGIVFGLLFIIIIAIFVFFYFFKDERPIFKKYIPVLEASDVIYRFPPHQFLSYWKKIQATECGLKLQFSKLTKSAQAFTYSTQVAQVPENKIKNRYVNILPFDENRVILPGGEYINASYIKGKSGKVEYIACQAPLKSTCKDFWTMILTENVSIVVMVTQLYENRKEKCYEYFPHLNASMIEDDITITCLTETYRKDYCLRTFEIETEHQVLLIKHFSFLNWPDFGVPKSTECLLNFCKDIRRHYRNGKIVVHCSAGVGRTGTFITVDMNLENIDDNLDINIYSTVINLRKQRLLMVQTFVQYEYIHKCIASYINNEFETTF
ncbi:unnamed protein product [Brassicogethes aeneus]|uniref:protein-tyrosine-phosphatase n=1 Tax=Brassicogethes aeneus TaxID=1431903 RepID=A0A9P0FMS8_BRAAE|nr:unnamed protein product [Brassicogethes aeneus]